MRLQPLRNKIAVIPIKEERIGSIYIPEHYQQKADHGIVKYKGSEVDDEIQVGDHVVFSGYTGTKIASESESDLIFLPVSHVEAIIVDEPRVVLIPSKEVKRIVTRAIEDRRILNDITDEQESILSDYICNMIDSVSFAEGLEF